MLCSVSLLAFKQSINKLFLLIQIIGKALVLDEIINYIQSLQRQVEVKNSLTPLCICCNFTCLNMEFGLQFLSMKLEVVNSGATTGPTIGAFPSGDVSPKSRKHIILLHIKS